LSERETDGIGYSSVLSSFSRHRCGRLIATKGATPPNVEASQRVSIEPVVIRQPGVRPCFFRTSLHKNRIRSRFTVVSASLTSSGLPTTLVAHHTCSRDLDADALVRAATRPALTNTPDTTAALNRITPNAYAILSSAHRITPMKLPNTQQNAYRRSKSARTSATIFRIGAPPNCVPTRREIWLMPQRHPNTITSTSQPNPCSSHQIPGSGAPCLS